MGKMMRYNVCYENNGRSGSRFVLAESEEQALERFRESWEEYGDTFEGSCWVDQAWCIG